MKSPSALLLAMEGRAMFEWASFAFAWPLLKTAPRGDGHPVLVLPGLCAGDNSTIPLRKFLAELGYVAEPWRQGLNFGPARPRHQGPGGPGARAAEAAQAEGEPGGLVARRRDGQRARVAHARTDPAGGDAGLAAHRAPARHQRREVFELVSGFRADDERLMELVNGEPEVPTTSIMSKTDGIVNWRMSLARESKIAENIEVSATHLGMGVNPAVLWVIADRLAQAEGAWKPFERSNALRSALYRDPHRFRFADLIAP
jgi:hypothetical protein